MFETFVSLLSLLLFVITSVTLPVSQRIQDFTDSKNSPQVQLKLEENINFRHKREIRESLCAISSKLVDVRDLLKYAKSIFDDDKGRNKTDLLIGNMRKGSNLYKTSLPASVRQIIRIEECGDEANVGFQTIACVQKYSEITVKINTTDKQTLRYPSFCALEIVNLLEK